MKKLILSSIILATACVCSLAEERLVAFPGAEGFGKYTVGGRGGQVVKVTNLQDYKTAETPIEGSLRWALEQYKSTRSEWSNQHNEYRNITAYEPLTVVFDVCGTIWLKEDLKVKRDSLTIAGQTAPCGGICIAGRSVLFNGATGNEAFYWGNRRKDLIVRYVRFRPGIPKDDTGTPTLSFVTYAVDMENYENVIFDHCSMSWANEEVLATYDTKNVTFQWNIVSEGLYCAYHKKGLRAYGGVWGGQYATYHHNLIAHQNSRTARFNGSRAHDTIAVVEYRNNVIYNWGNSDGACGGEFEGGLLTLPESRSELNIFNNYYKRGAATSTSNTVSASNKAHRILQCYDATSAVKKGQHYVNGNYVKDFPTVTADNWNYGVQFKNTGIAFDEVKRTALSPEVLPLVPASLETAAQAFAQVIANAGANLPLRDAIDTRILTETENGTVSGKGTLYSFQGESTVTNSTYYNQTKGIIDDPEAVGGWVDLTCAEPAKLDKDGDGIPDEWEIANGLDKNNPEDRNDIAPSGYTWLEEFLNNSVVPTPDGLKDVLSASLQISLSEDGNALRIVSDIAVRQADIISPLGKIVSSGRPTGEQLNISRLSKGFYLLRLAFENGEIFTTPFIK